MNPIDIVVLVIVGICVLWGLYRGFLQSLLKLGGGLGSLLLSFRLYPKLSDLLSQNTGLIKLITTYTGSNSLLGNLDMSSLPVNALTQPQIAAIVEKADLPRPIDTLLLHNLQQQVFSPMGDMVTKVGDYVNQTILSVSINAICFLLCFLGLYAASSFLINAVSKIARLPILRRLNGLAGGLMGLLLGILICFCVFSILPILESVIRLDSFREMVNSSQMAQVFSNSNLLISIMNRKLNLSL